MCNYKQLAFYKYQRQAVHRQLHLYKATQLKVISPRASSNAHQPFASQVLVFKCIFITNNKVYTILDK